METKGGNKGLDFLQGKGRVSVPKKSAEAPKVVTPVTAPAATPAVAPVAPNAPYAAAYRVAVGGKSFDVQVSG
jgi:pyruvate carboxylase subunit B